VFFISSLNVRYSRTLRLLPQELGNRTDFALAFTIYLRACLAASAYPNLTPTFAKTPPLAIPVSRDDFGELDQQSFTRWLTGSREGKTEPDAAAVEALRRSPT
jgi:hypothetical protein